MAERDDGDYPEDDRPVLSLGQYVPGTASAIVRRERRRERGTLSLYRGGVCACTRTRRPAPGARDRYALGRLHRAARVV